MSRVVVVLRQSAYKSFFGDARTNYFANERVYRTILECAAGGTDEQAIRASSRAFEVREGHVLRDDCDEERNREYDEAASRED